MPDCPHCDGVFAPDDQSRPHCGFVFKSTPKLKEQVAFGPHGITSTDWHSYPILRLHDAPKIETMLLNRPGLSYLGIGEAVQGPIPVAIANAVFDTVGIRLRQIPFKPG